MISIDFTPRGVCSRNIHVDLSDDGTTIEGVSFVGGVTGRTVEEVTGILRGNLCGNKGTSCADQLCCALDAAQEQARA